jgi:N-methylhydantoinase A
VRKFNETSDAEVLGMLADLESIARQTLIAEGVANDKQSTEYQIDLRYRGQGMRLTISLAHDEFAEKGLAGVATRFDEMHTQLFTFALDAPHELVNLRAVVQGPETLVMAEKLTRGGEDASAAVIEQTTVFVDGTDRAAKIYDRAKLLAGNKIPGPAIVSQMDTTTLILPGHTGEVDAVGNILIRPNV